MSSGVAVIAIPLLIFEACSSTPQHSTLEQPPANDASTNPPDQQQPAPQPDGAKGNGACDLKAAGLQFSTPSCQDCMQTNCCALTIACSITDKTCAELQQCYIDCPAPGPGVDAGPVDAGDAGDGGKKEGGGGGGGDGGGTGNACRDACAAKYPGAVALAKGYNDCTVGPCGQQCLGLPPPDAGHHDGGGDGGPKDAGDGG